MSSPLYDKRAARHDFIEIDGTDYSNAFNAFSLSSEDTLEDASGFSESGVDENIPGSRAQGFEGTYFVSDEVMSAFWQIHNAREIVRIEWRKNGLLDSGAPLYYANCYITQFRPESTRGSVETSPFSATVADADGVRMTGT